MTYEQYQMMFYIALTACIILFLLTVILFFVLKIPRVFGDITGLSRKKAIRNINEQSEKAKIFHESENETNRVSPSGRIISDYTGNIVITEKIPTKRVTKGQETVVLSGNTGETTLLPGNAGETTVLTDFDVGETTLLTENMAFPTVETEQSEQLQIAMTKGYAREIQSIVFIHTDEIIG